MQAGKLRHRVLIQQPGTTQDSIGQVVPTWTNLITAGDGKVWADVRQLSGLESIRGGAELSIVKASIRIRYRTDVTAAMRVTHGSTVYQVKAVLPDLEGSEFVDLACEVVA
jgi:SPP1 family predicted phage head-tail adaptor